MKVVSLHYNFTFDPYSTFIAWTMNTVRTSYLQIVKSLNIFSYIIKVGKYLIQILWNKCYIILTWLSGYNFLWQNIKHYYFYIISSFEKANSKHFNHKITFLFFFRTNNIKISNFLTINWHKYQYGTVV